MNGTWLAFFTFMLVVLIAVAVGANQMEAQKAQEIAQLMAQRDNTLNVALEAKAQRDDAVAKVDGMAAEIAALKGDKERVHRDFQNATSAAERLQNENDRLVSEYSQLKAQMSDLQAQHADLQAKHSQLEQGLIIPVVGSESTERAETVENKSICLPVQADNLPNQLGLGLAILVGMAALGSGGYIYYRHDPERKYEVRMTKDQIREYARYQRERGN